MDSMVAERLRTEYLDNPLGIDILSPRLGWIVSSVRRGASQTAYRLLVSSSPQLLDRLKGDLWDSGKVESSETQHIEYAGKELASEQAVYWKVQVWDERGVAGPWSEAASWSMGLLSRELWSGQWIGWKNERKPTKEEPKPNIYLRHGFQVGAGVKIGRASCRERVL